MNHETVEYPVLDRIDSQHLEIMGDCLPVSGTFNFTDPCTEELKRRMTALEEKLDKILEVLCK